MDDIRVMISQEQRRIEGKPLDPVPTYVRGQPMVLSAYSPVMGSPMQPSSFPVPGDASAADALKPYRPPQKEQGSQVPASSAVQGLPTSVAASKRELTQQQVSLTQGELQALLREHQMAMAKDPTISRTDQILQQQLGRSLTSFEKEQARSVLLALERIKAIPEQPLHQRQMDHTPSLLPPLRNAFKGYAAAVQPERIAMPAISQSVPASPSSTYTLPQTPAWSLPSIGSMNNAALPGNRANLKMTFPPISSLLAVHNQQSSPAITPQNQNLQHQYQIQGHSQSYNQNPNQSPSQGQGQSERHFRGPVSRDRIPDQGKDRDIQ